MFDSLPGNVVLSLVNFQILSDQDRPVRTVEPKVQ